MVSSCIEMKISNTIVDVIYVDTGMDFFEFHEFFLNNWHGVAWSTGKIYLSKNLSETCGNLIKGIDHG